MTNLIYATTEVDNLLSKVDSVVTVTCELLKDPRFSLEDRWSLYLKIEKLLPIDTYISNVINILTDSVYDDFYMERHQVKSYSQIAETILEGRTQDGDDPDDYSEAYDRMYAKFDEFREAVLSSGYGGFENDW